MRTGRLNTTITISSLTTATSGGDVTETWSTGDTVRASVKQINGSRYLKAEELVDREIYEIETWDKSYGNDLKITYGTKTLYPIQPPTFESDRSNRTIIKIIAATKG
jgi:head-tail adaptor